MKGRKIFAIHSILGLIAGVFLLVISLSGSILVFSEEIDHQLNPPLLKVEAQHTKVSLDSVYKRAQLIFPGQYIRFRHLPQQPDQSIELSIEHDDVWLFAYFNPYTCEYLGSRNANTYFMGWLVGLHYSLLGGAFGQLVVGVLSIVLILSLITGIYVYKKHIIDVLAFKVRVSFKNSRKAYSSLHRVVGVWSLVFNMLFAITGFWMLRYVFFPETYQATATVKKIAYPFSVSLDSLKLSIEKDKNFRVSSFFLPKAKNDNIIIYGSVSGQSEVYNEYANSIEIDSKTGKEITRSLINEQSALGKWDLIAYSLHTGQYGNFLLKIIYCIAGLSPALLSISGFFIWLKRKKFLN
jgi:uncharacterized iron-regulated membrane protein